MKKIFFLLSIALIGLTACSREEDDIFGSSAAERANEAITEYTNLLTSAAKGWEMKYYPSSNLEYGGFTVTLLFDKNGTVTVASDVEDPSETSTSLYKVTQSAGIVLSFDTYNEVLHLFSDPSAPLAGDAGAGMSGDYDFNFIEASAEKIVLKGKRSGTYAEMTPVKDESWDALYEELATVEETMWSKKYGMVIGDQTVLAYSDYRTLTFSYIEDEEEREAVASYIITKKGMEFYEPVTILGKTIEGFAYAEDASSFTALNDKSLKLEIIIPPIAEQFAEGTWFLTDQATGNIATYISAALAGETAIGETIGYMYFGTDANGLGLYFWSSGYTGYLGFTVTVLDETHVKIAFKGTAAGDGAWYYQNAGYNYFCKALAGTFTVEADDVTSPSYVILTNTDGDKIMLSADVVYYPFGK